MQARGQVKSDLSQLHEQTIELLQLLTSIVETSKARFRRT
ncbi:hypothetical protein [Povalibacter sp.]